MDLTFTYDELPQAAAHFWKYADLKRVFAFHGEMGAGKTTMIHALCAAKGVTSPLSSPTYTIINEYLAGDERIYHIDLYRLNDVQAAVEAGVEECLYSGSWCFVEWPERATPIFPDDTVQVFLRVVEGGARRISIGEK